MKKAFALLSCFVAAGGIALAALTACETGTATDEAIITSVTVRASDVTRGLGCSERAGQVYKYAVIAHVASNGSRGAIVETKLADCFADATFIDPPIVSDTSYVLDVYLYDRAGFDSQPSLASIVASPPSPADAADPVVLPGAFGKLTCTVTALFQVQAFSSCGEASALPVAARPDASSGDSSVDAAATDASDATLPSDSSTDAGADAGDAADD